MEDVRCPYCETGQEINHDDGYGFTEDEIHEQQCGNCHKTFGFTTSISFYHEAVELPCANGGEHSFKPTMTAPKMFTKMRCKYCEIKRPPTEEEKKEHNIPEIKIN